MRGAGPGAAARHGRLDGLVNNVGWFPRATIAETTTDLWNKIMNLNLRGAMYCCKHTIPLLAAAGGGSVISINSPHGLQASHNLVAYGAAKAGLHNMMKTLAGAHAPDRIRFNSVSPGWVMSEGEIALQTRQGMTAADRERIGATLPLGRFQQPEDTAKTVVFLLSDDSSQITGMFFSVDAGMTTLSQRRA